MRLRGADSESSSLAATHLARAAAAAEKKETKEAFKCKADVGPSPSAEKMQQRASYLRASHAQPLSSSSSRSAHRKSVRLRLCAALFLQFLLLLHNSGFGAFSLIFSGEWGKRHALLRRNTAAELTHKLLLDFKHFKNVKIQNLDKFEDVLAVALDNATLFAYNVNKDENGSPKLKEIWRSELSAEKRPLSLLEFRLTDRRTLLFCDAQMCHVCHIEKREHCALYSLPTTNDGNSGFADLRGWLPDRERLILRTVSADDTHNGALYALKPGMRNATNLAPDRIGIEDVTVVGSFSTESHTFFVGSASKIDVPYNIFSEDKTRRRRLDLRVTRVCNRDTTRRFESRIDVALSCADMDDGDGYENASPKRAKTASLSPDGKRLLVLIESGPGPSKISENEADVSQRRADTVCEFDVDVLIERFDETWRFCQQNNVQLSEQCKGSGASKNERCYIFAWSRSARVPLCEGLLERDKFADNCALSASKSSASRNYWLENYQPLMGKVVARLGNDMRQILGVFESSWREVLFISRPGSVERLRKNATTKLSLWVAPLPLSTFTAAVLDDATNSLIFTEQNKLKYIHLTCEDFYPTCDLISWQDPLRCGWCADERGGGHTFSFVNHDACPNGAQNLNKCPPKIIEVTYDRGRYTIFGDGFDNVDDLRFSACEEECKIENKMNTLVRCSTSHSEICPLLLNGKVGAWNNFRLIFSDHLEETKFDDDGVFAHFLRNHSRLVRILVTIFVVFTLFTVLIIVWQLYRKYADRIRIKVRQNAEKSPKGKYLTVSTGDFGDADGGLPLSHSHQHTTHTHHTHPHLSFSGTTSTSNSVSAFGCGVPDDLSAYDAGVLGPNQIDKSRIFFLKQIGDGNSSTVHLAKYVVDADADVSRRVAVKTICNTSFDIKDVMREVELISRCRHKNVVEYVGHFEDNFGRMHIVTEYMAGGDLHQFLISPTNKLTVGDAFLFILQICEGMEYLTKQHIIHRDLAARNCMLDQDNVVVKITDFGLCRTSNVDYEYISENAAQQLPFRWTAIECFGTNRKFSEKSDVWSFGVVVWEIFARDLTPYTGKDSSGVREFLKSGNRLEFEQIPSCPYEIYERIILPCWENLPHDRPSFTELRVEIERIYWTVKNSTPEYLKTEYETPISSIGSPTPSFPSPTNGPTATTLM